MNDEIHTYRNRAMTSYFIPSARGLRVFKSRSGFTLLLYEHLQISTDISC